MRGARLKSPFRSRHDDRNARYLPHVRPRCLRLRGIGYRNTDRRVRTGSINGAHKEALLFVANHCHYPEDSQIKDTPFRDGRIAPD